MSEQFPLCKKAGLKIDYHYALTTGGSPGCVGQAAISEHWIRAEHVESLLASALEVTGDTNSDTGWAFFYRSDGGHPSCGHTHRAKVLLIEPIRTDSAEDLLRELIDLDELAKRVGVPAPGAVELISRVRAFLDKRGSDAG